MTPPFPDRRCSDLADEPLHAAERRAMDHDRAVRLVVRADVAEIEPLGELVVHLHRAELPLPAEDILDHEVDLRAIERRLARLGGEGDTQRSEENTSELQSLLRISYAVFCFK